ncbi:hypothetical protein [Massilia sp. TN1-12]|uniref:hypothetical protein n=1 Tax=Massilia paldalensis TaxID=3377675 RepID=UPI0038506923
MKTKTPLLRSIVVACTLCVAAAGSALAQSQTAKKPGDPARWYTKQQTSTTLKKEINAAYAEQKSACNRGAKSERAGCLADARKTYQNDMKNMTQLAQNTPAGGVSERVVTTTEGDGSSAVGSSQGGATASGGMDAGAAATGGTGSTGSMGSSSSGITASGTSQSDAEAATSASGQPQVPQTQPMQPPPVTTPPRSEDAPIQR